MLGHTCATLLGQFDLPMTTTQLATKLSLTAPTLNADLKSLQAVGLMSSRRDGRSVLYVRADLGERLLAAIPAIKNRYQSRPSRGEPGPVRRHRSASCATTSFGTAAQNTNSAPV